MKGTRAWVYAVAAALGVAAACSLGFWQLGRAAQKIALDTAIEQRKSLPARDQSGLAAIKNIADEVFRPVVLQGRWVAGKTVWLDNRQMHGKPGFYVLTPLALDGGGIVVVQRGWAPRDFMERERLPAVQTPDGTVRLEGRIAPPPAKLYAFGGAETGAIRQNLDLQAFAAQERLALRTDLTVQQLGPASEGLQREWPQAASGVEKHYGYAFQWFALGALIAILYVWFQFIAPRRARRA